VFKNIYFLNFKLLALKLRQNEISDRDAVKYLILSGIILGGSATLPIEISDQDIFSNYIDLIFTVLSFIIPILINIFGIWSLFRINSTGDGKHFFKRIICLSFPVGNYLFLIFAIPVLAAFFYAAAKENSALFGAFEFITIVLLLSFYYRYLYKCLSFISTTENEKSG